MECPEWGHWAPFKGGYLSGTLKAICDAFARARAKAPCILFIDEIYGISDRATIRGEYVQYWTQVVNCLLEHLAGVKDQPGVVVVAATNHPDRIDAAVRRAGCLDRGIAIGKPDTETLSRIFRHHFGPDTLADASLMPLALAAPGTPGAEAFVRHARTSLQGHVSQSMVMPTVTMARSLAAHFS